MAVSVNHSWIACVLHSPHMKPHVKMRLCCQVICFCSLLNTCFLHCRLAFRAALVEPTTQDPGGCQALPRRAQIAGQGGRMAVGSSESHACLCGAQCLCQIGSGKCLHLAAQAITGGPQLISKSNFCHSSRLPSCHCCADSCLHGGDSRGVVPRRAVTTQMPCSSCACVCQ